MTSTSYEVRPRNFASTVRIMELKLYDDMIDKRAYELLCCLLCLEREEETGLRKQVNELIEKLKAIEESNKKNSKTLADTINELSATVESYRKEMELMMK